MALLLLLVPVVAIVPRSATRVQTLAAIRVCHREAKGHAQDDHATISPQKNDARYAQLLTEDLVLPAYPFQLTLQRPCPILPRDPSKLVPRPQEGVSALYPGFSQMQGYRSRMR